MIKVTIEIEQLPCVTNGRVHGAIDLKVSNHSATTEEIRVLEDLVTKVKEIGKEIGQETRSEVCIWEKKVKQSVRHIQPANH